jgi:replicative DNA helicase
MDNQNFKDKDFRVSLARNAYGGIEEKIFFSELAHRITSDPILLGQGERFRRLYRESPSLYDSKKTNESGAFLIGEFSGREDRNIEKYESIIALDIDSLTTRDIARKAFDKLRSWPYTLALFPSLSGAGLRHLVRVNSPREAHIEAYRQVGEAVAKILNFPTKKEMKDSLKALRLSGDQIKDYLGKNPHVDTVTKNLARIWFYSGVPKEVFFLNWESKTFEVQSEKRYRAPQVQISRPGSPGGHIVTEEDRIEKLISLLGENGVDITPTYDDWLAVAAGIANEFGEAGRSYFHNISSLYSGYEYKAADKHFDSVLPQGRYSKFSMGSVYGLAKRSGIEIDFQELLQEKRGLVAQPKKKEVIEISTPSDIEQAVIAALIRTPSFLDLIHFSNPKFSEKCFSSYEGQRIYECLRKMREKGFSISFLAVKAQLKYYGLDPNALEGYRGGRGNEQDFTTWIRIIYEEHIRRLFFEMATGATEEISSSQEDIFDLIIRFQDGMGGLLDFGTSSTEGSGADVARSILERYNRIREARKKNASSLTGIPTGIFQLDMLLSGYQDSDLIIIAGRPSMGKTALVLKSIRENIDKGTPVGLLSLEMSSDQIGNRIISQKYGIELSQIINAQIPADRIRDFQSALEWLEKAPLHIDDKAGASIRHIRQIARKWKRQHGIRALYVDYLQLIREEGKDKRNREQEVSKMSRGLKEIAKELHIPVIALSQLSRAVETRRGDKRPILSDLRESGAIEQDADIVAFAYRPEYYEILEDEDGNSLAGIAEIIVRKHRNGALGTAKAFFDKEYAEFKDTLPGKYDSEAASTQFPVKNETIPVGAQPDTEKSDVPF